MRDLIIIPTYNRPEYLHLCLDRIRKAIGDRDIAIHVWHDYKGSELFTEQTVKVCTNFTWDHALFIRCRFRAPHTGTGNIRNFLDAYTEAFAGNYRYVYLIEDDVLVSPDFFDWHEAVQARWEYFCSVGWHDIRNPEVKNNPTGDPHAVVESAVDFSSIGVCWKRENLAAIVRHATEDYYRNPSSYLLKTFPNSPIPYNRWVEQAGLIMRELLEGKGNRVVAWAGLPRCGHIGFHGYHRPGGFQVTGTLEEKVKQLETALADPSFPNIGDLAFDDINLPPSPLPWTAENLYVSKRF